MVLGEVRWLHMSGWGDAPASVMLNLSPRQKTVLNLLLNGLGRKQIAQHLKIKDNTVAGYTKEIYRVYEVRSQPELMRKFMSGQVSIG